MSSDMKILFEQPEQDRNTAAFDLVSSNRLKRYCVSIYPAKLGSANI